MSTSAFYRNFQAVTAMSPIQFQKQIRLQEARLLLATHPGDVTGVALSRRLRQPVPVQPRVPPQFGTPPREDAAQLHGIDESRSPALP